MGVLIAIVALNIWASWRVFADDLSSLPQRWAQFAFVWLVPVLGALVALQLKKEPERGSGSYPGELGEVDDYTAEAARRVREGASGSPNHVDPSPDQ